MYNCSADLHPSMVDEFLAHMTMEGAGGCRLWQGPLDAKGYGKVTGEAHRRITGAHRVAYILSKGPIPEGLVIDHLCRVRNCVNPAHLEAVTSAENTRRGFPGRKASPDCCINGHSWIPGSYYVPAGGTKQCKKCRYEAKVRYRAKLKAARLAA